MFRVESQPYVRTKSITNGKLLVSYKHISVQIKDNVTILQSLQHPTYSPRVRR